MVLIGHLYSGSVNWQILHRCTGFWTFYTLFGTKALRYKLFSVKALSARLRKLTQVTKRLIAIIIVSFVIAKINENQRLNNRDYGNNEF